MTSSSPTSSHRGRLFFDAIHLDLLTDRLTVSQAQSRRQRVLEQLWNPAGFREPLPAHWTRSLAYSSEVSDCLPSCLAREERVAPLDLREGRLLVGIVEPLDAERRRRLAGTSSREIVTVPIDPEDLETVLALVYPPRHRIETLCRPGGPPPDGAAVLQSLVQWSALAGGLPISVEGTPDGMQVRIRHGERIYPVVSGPRTVLDALVAELHHRTGAPGAPHAAEPPESAAPLSLLFQDRMEEPYQMLLDGANPGGSRGLRVRVESCPTLHGGRVLISITSDQPLSVASLSLLPQNAKRLLARTTSHPRLVVVLGRPGSGKTTTALALMSELSARGRLAITLESQIRRSVHGLQQMLVDPREGRDTARMLEVAQSHAPDALMVDAPLTPEAMQKVLAAARRGVSTVLCLPVVTFPEAIERLEALGVPRAEQATSVSLFFRQRILPKICPGCRGSDLEGWDAIENRTLRFPVYRGEGCGLCCHSGVAGNLGSVPAEELVVVGSRTWRALTHGLSPGDVHSIAGFDEALRLNDAAYLKLRQGLVAAEHVGALFVRRSSPDAATHAPPLYPVSVDVGPAPRSTPPSSAPPPTTVAARSEPAPGTPGSVKIMVEVGGVVRKTYEIEQGTVMVGVPYEGELPDIDLEPFDVIGIVSPWHLRLRRQGRELTVLDETGRSTLHNGKPLTQFESAVLQPGDTLEIPGGIVLKVSPEPGLDDLPVM